MSDYMLEATKDSLVFDFSRNSIYTQGNEFGYTGVVCYEIPASQLTSENRKLITNIYKTHSGEIGVTYTSLGSGDTGDSVVGGIRLNDIAVTGPTTYANIISNITQDGLGQIGYTYTRIYTGHTTYDGVENNNGTYSINGVNLSTNGELSFTYRDLTVTEGTATQDVVLGGENPSNIKVITAISESPDGKISYSYSDISSIHTSYGEWKYNDDYYNRLITNVKLDSNGNFTYSYYHLEASNNTPKYKAVSTEDISGNNLVNVVNIDSVQDSAKNNALRVVTDVSILHNNNLTIGLEYSYSYIYSSSSHHNTLNGTKGETIRITGEGVPLINGTYLSPEGTLSYSYSNYIVQNASEAETLTYLTVNEIAHSESLYSLVDIFKDVSTGRVVALKTSLETTTNGGLTEIPINSVSYFEVIDNIYQMKDGKITYTSKKIVNSHNNTASTARTNHIINNVSINSYGDLSYTYYDASVDSGYFTNQVQRYNSHNTGISGVTIPQTYIPVDKDTSISVVNGVSQGPDGQLTYSYISLWSDTTLFTKHIVDLNKEREYTADEAVGNTVPVVYLLNNTSNNGTIVDRTYLNYSTIEVPTKNYLDNLMQANDALRYCGTVDASASANGTITLHYHPSGNTSGFDENNPDLLKGAVYKITNTGYIGSERVTPGDMIISYADSPSPTLVNPITGWDVINENIDIRQSNSTSENELDSTLVVTNVHISADGELTYTYSPISIRTFDRTNPSAGESLRTLDEGVASYNISTNSTGNIGIPVITYVGTSYTGLTHDLEFKVSYIYASQNHHSYQGTQTAGNRVITNVNLSNDGKLSYSYNTETAVTYTGSLIYSTVPTTSSIDTIDILHTEGEVNNNIGYNVITGIKLERHENEISLSYNYTSIFANQNHHQTIYPETYTDVILSAEGTKLLSGAALTDTGTFTYSVSNIIVADAGTLSAIAGVQVESYTYSVVNIYKDMSNHGVITYSFVDLSMSEEDGTKLEPITVKEDTSINVITHITQRGDGKITYSYTPINIASLWERGNGDISVQTVNSGSIAGAAYSVAGGYFVTTTSEVGESAFGRYNNISNSHLIHSIGIGYYDLNNSTSYRVNAIEILSNGDFYLYGVGNYNGTNSTEDNSYSVQQYIENREIEISTALDNLNQKDIDLQNQIDSLPIVWEPGENTYSVQQIGSGAKAVGDYSIAESEGFSYGNSSHAEGIQTISGGNASHAEGNLTYTKGSYSHTEGYRTYTYNIAEHTEGSNNFSHQGSTTWGGAFNTLSSVGMGQPEQNDTYRQNALEIMQNGDMYVYGLGYYDGKDPTNALPLQKYIETVGVWEKGQGTYAVQVRNTQSYALGSYSLASGRFSYAYGQYSIAEGYQSYALGSYSTSIGRNSYAIGENSFATGYYTYAIGKTSTSSGYFTYAYGEASHTEGKLTYALGSYSHAEGAYTYAEANHSHAEGWKSRASGSASHAEGWNNIASGVGAHAEGGNFEEGGNTASGFGSHAEGQGTYAIGAATHAEGSHTTAHQQCSHTEGSNSYTLGQSSHAEGIYTYTYNSAEHSEGQYNLSHKENTAFGNSYNTIHTTGIGTSNTNRKNAVAIMQNGDFYLINIGDYDGTNPKTSYSLQEFIEKIGVWERGTGELSVQTRGTTCQALAPYSIAEGILTITNSEAIYSHVEGEKTYTVGRASHAEGQLSYSYGVGSHAEGIQTYSTADGSHTEGTYTTSKGESSHAEGHNTYSYGKYSHVEGYEKIAIGEASHAEGSGYIFSHFNISFTGSGLQYTSQIGLPYVKEGYIVYSTTNKLFAKIVSITPITNRAPEPGQGVTITVDTSLGNLTDEALYIYSSGAIGNYSHSEGYSSQSIGQSSHAEGVSTISYSEGSHAEGIETYAFGNGSHTEGYKTTTYGIYTQNTIEVGNAGVGSDGLPLPGAFSHAEGRGTIANGGFSHAEGNRTLASGGCSHVEGSLNIASGNASHAEGNRTLASYNSSHAEGTFTLSGGQSSHAEGFYSYAIRAASHAEGNYTYSYGVYSHTEGAYTYTFGLSSHAEGWNTYTYGDYSHSEGLNTIANGDCSHTEGQLTYTDSNNSHAEGYLSYATASCAHAEGNQTTASGLQSHAEGRQTHAEGDDSHAEGFCSYTTATNSHVEGSNTYAYNYAEHAEGAFNVSHTGEGSATTWYGSPSYTVSSVGIGNQYYDQELQQQVTTRKNAIEIMQNGDFYLYGIGDYDGTNPDDATTLQTYLTTAGVWERGDGTLAVQTKETSSYAVGDYTVAAGYFTYAYNQAESSFGQYNKSNYYEGENFGYCYNTIHSIGIGYIFHDTENDEDIEVRKNALEITQNGEIYLLGIGEYDGTNTELAYSLKEVIIEDELIISYAFNDLDQRIDILQYQIDDIPAPVFERGQGIMSIQQTDSGSTASGTYSFVMGQNSTVSGNYSNILGTNCTTSSNYSTTLGSNNTNTGHYTFVGGNNNASAAESSIILGSSNGVNNYINNILIGSSNQSDGSNVFSVGRNNTFESSNAASIGISNTISDQYSFILGYNNTSSSNYSGVLGISNTNSGLYTFTVGSGNNISANYGLAIGSNNTISGIRSIGIGNNIKSLVDNEIGIGKYNYSNGSILEIGIGTSDSDRKNALEVDSTGDLYLLGVGDYNGSNTSSAKSLQLYLEENERTISEAFNDLNDRVLNLNDLLSQIVSSPFNYGSGDKAIQSIGTNCSAIGDFSFAEGNGTIANNQYEVALGAFNKSNSGNTIDTKTAFSLGIGTSNSNRIDSLEIMKNGDMYVYGIGNYDGTNPTGNNVLSLQEAISDLYSKVGDAQALQNFTLSASTDSDGNDVISITIGSITRSVTLTNTWGIVPTS